MSTYLATLPLSSTVTAAASDILPPHDKGGTAVNAPSSFESMFTLEITSPPDVSPPGTTRVTLTAQHTLGLAYKQKRGQHLPP
mmetsp:Transcript_11929/g.28941  ORF Transcript_11929/g.28941 Transcript_11929/m.28941 type:complete len:83 (+) Transcript_11929:503-751(+)